MLDAALMKIPATVFRASASFLLLLFVLLLPVADRAAASARVEREYTTAELVSEVAAVAREQSFWVGLRLTPREGWHTYWRTPGDSGMPTHIEWELPAGVSAGPIVWPAPQRIDYGPLVNFGYKRPVVLLTRLTIAREAELGASLPLKARADWLVCEEICVPEDAELTLDLPVATDLADGALPSDSRGAALIAAATAEVPRAVPWEGRFAEAGDRVAFEIQPLNIDPSRVSGSFFFPIEEGVMVNAAPQAAEWKDDRLVIRTERGFARDLPKVSGVLRLALDGRDKFFEVTLTRADRASATALLPAAPLGQPSGAGDASTAGDGASGGILRALLFAFIGGLILNLMPCVFPVLSLKALSVAAKAGQDKGAVRAEALVFTAGVLASFLVIAGGLLLLRAGGEMVGWGFQLQSPLVVTILAYVLFLVGLNLSGFYEFSSRFAGIGGTLAARPGYGGAFFTGVLATVVATPCTAPFMAAAVGFALVQPPLVMLAIFIALGLGLAAPFLLFAAAPGLQRLLPKPGPWMVTFKEFLAFPMYGAAGWLVWVLAQQTGPSGVAAALLGMVLLAFAIWAFRRAGGRARIFARVIGLAAAALALALAVMPQDEGAAVAAGGNGSSGPVPSVAYAPETVADFRAEGRPVFVNFTAAWCITCLVNERVALRSDAIAQAFADANVAYVKGDWTNRDPVITQALREFGRSGVPLYVLYPPDDDRKPIVLPQILTEDTVLQALSSL